MEARRCTVESAQLALGWFQAIGRGLRSGKGLLTNQMHSQETHCRQRDAVFRLASSRTQDAGQLHSTQADRRVFRYYRSE